MHFQCIVVQSLFEDYFKLISVKNLYLNRGKLSLKPQLSVGNIDLEVSELYIDDQTNSWYNLFEEVKLGAHQIAFTDKDIELRGNALQVGRRFDQVNLSDWDFKYRDHDQVVDGNFDSLQFSGIHLDSILAGSYTSFDSVRIVNPQIKMELSISNGNTPKNNGFTDKYLEVVNGQLEAIINDSSFFRAEKINTALTIGDTNHIYYGQFDQIDINSPPIGHRIKAGSLTIEESQELHLEAIEIEGIKKLQAFQLNGKIPFVDIYGLDQTAFWKDDHLEADSLIIVKPGINLKLAERMAEHEKNNRYEIRLGKIVLEKANLIFSDENQEVFKQIEVSELSAVLVDFDYPNKSMVSEDVLLYADDLRLDIKYLHPVMENGDSVLIKNLAFRKKITLF